jgi:hypothetical protein
MPGTLRAANHRESVTCHTPTAADNRYALIACGPTNRCKTPPYIASSHRLTSAPCRDNHPGAIPPQR